VDFKKIFNLYINAPKKLRRSQYFYQTLIDSYRTLRSKKSKLRAGSMRFVEKSFLYGKVPIYRWFEIEYSAQVTSTSGQSWSNHILTLLEFSWNLQTICCGFLFLIIGFLFLKLNLFDFYYELIFTDSLTTAKAATFSYLVGSDRGCPAPLRTALQLLSESLLPQIL
jgi:hypothetical protein